MFLLEVHLLVWYTNPYNCDENDILVLYIVAGCIAGTVNCGKPNVCDRPFGTHGIMARTAHRLPEEVDITHLLSTGVLASACPRTLVEKVLQETGKASQRVRLLPATAVVYYVMALSLWREVPLEEVFRVICEGLSWLGNECTATPKICKASISQARTKLGSDVMKRLADEVLSPLAPPGAIGAWYRGFRLMALDGSVLDLPDNEEVAEHFGYPSSSRGEAAFPQVRILSLVETGTHAIVGAEFGPYRVSEQKLAGMLLPTKLMPDMLLLADRNFYGYWLWKSCSEKSNLLWRVKTNLILTKEQMLPDGSYISRVYDSKNHAKNDPIVVRVIEYVLKKSDKPQERYRLLTNILDPNNGPAKELASLYHERWEIETSFNEVKTGLKGRSTLIRSRTPDLIKQEVWGLLMTHYAIRSLMAKAAWAKHMDPDKLSFINSVRIVKRKLPHVAASPPCETEDAEEDNS
jgi:hypothetical protein